MGCSCSTCPNHYHARLPNETIKEIEPVFRNSPSAADKDRCVMDCAGRAQRRRRFRITHDTIFESNIALRLPPQPNTRRLIMRLITATTDATTKSSASWTAPAKRSDDGAFESPTTRYSKAASPYACHRSPKLGGQILINSTNAGNIIEKTRASRYHWQMRGAWRRMRGLMTLAAGAAVMHVCPAPASLLGQHSTRPIIHGTRTSATRPWRRIPRH